MNSPVRTGGRLVGAVVVAVALMAGPAPAQTPPPPPASPAPPTVSPSDVEPSGDVDVALPSPAGPAPDPAPAGTLNGTGGEGGPGWFDLGGRIREAINDWFRHLVASALNPALALVGRTVLVTPDVSGPGRVRELWAVSAGMANAFFVLFVLVGGTIVMSHETLQTRYSAKQIAPRLVVGMIVANASLALAGQAIAVANGLSQALVGQGVDPASATAAMRAMALGPLEAGGGIVLILLGGVAAVLALVLVVVYIVRVALVVVLVAAAPLALACHALPPTEGLARLWWRAFLAVLAVQVGQALVLVSALRVFFAADGRALLGLSAGDSLIDLLVVVCLLWVLVRIPVWASKAVFGGRGSTVVRAAKTVVIYRVLRAASRAVG